MRTLDEIVESIRRSLHAGAYQIGLDLVAIEAGKLWSAQHASFAAFVRERLGRTPYWAYNHIRVVGAFSESQLRTLGVSRALLVLRAHPRRREALAREAWRMGKRDLEARVAQYNRVDGYSGESVRSRSASLSAKGRAKRLRVDGVKETRGVLEACLERAERGDLGAVVEMLREALGRTA